MTGLSQMDRGLFTKQERLLGLCLLMFLLQLLSGLLLKGLDAVTGGLQELLCGLWAEAMRHETGLSCGSLDSGALMA